MEAIVLKSRSAENLKASNSLSESVRSLKHFSRLIFTGVVDSILVGIDNSS
jgi:hypothetical protein